METSSYHFEEIDSSDWSEDFEFELGPSNDYKLFDFESSIEFGASSTCYSVSTEPTALRKSRKIMRKNFRTK